MVLFKKNLQNHVKIRGWKQNVLITEETFYKGIPQNEKCIALQISESFILREIPASETIHDSQAHLRGHQIRVFPHSKPQIRIYVLLYQEIL